MAAMMFGIDGPSIATSISPSMSDGKASNMSIACIVTASKRSPRQPASMPIAEPAAMAIIVALKLMTSDTRAP